MSVRSTGLAGVNPKLRNSFAEIASAKVVESKLFELKFPPLLAERPSPRVRSKLEDANVPVTPAIEVPATPSYSTIKSAATWLVDIVTAAAANIKLKIFFITVLSLQLG